MKTNQLEGVFNSDFELLLPTVTETFNQLFQKDFTTEIANKGEASSITSIGEGPGLKLSFSVSNELSVSHWIILPADLVLNLVAWMLGMEPDSELNDEHVEAMQEVCNQIFGQIQVALDAAGRTIKFGDVEIVQVDSSLNEKFENEEESVLRVEIRINVEDDFHLVGYHIQATGSEASVLDDELSPSADSGQTMSNEDVDINFDDFGNDASPVEISPADFGSFGGGEPADDEPRNINMLLDVELNVMAELGRKTMLVKDVLKLGKGAVVELDKAAGEPLELFVNGTKLAEGEVVVVEDHFGIRITQLAAPKDRIKSLG